jgi:hypothetical protein
VTQVQLVVSTLAEWNPSTLSIAHIRGNAFQTRGASAPAAAWSPVMEQVVAASQSPLCLRIAPGILNCR